MYILTMAILTMAILTMAILTVAIGAAAPRRARYHTAAAAARRDRTAQTLAMPSRPPAAESTTPAAEPTSCGSRRSRACAPPVELWAAGLWAARLWAAGLWAAGLWAAGLWAAEQRCGRLGPVVLRWRYSEAPVKRPIQLRLVVQEEPSWPRSSAAWPRSTVS